MMRQEKCRGHFVCVVIFMLAGALLTGCAGKKETQLISRQETAGVTTTAETETDEKITENVTEAESMTAVMEEKEERESEENSGNEKYEDNFSVDAEAAEAFAEKIKKATAAKDLDALAELMTFPVYVGLPDVDIVETKEEFLALGAETVFTDALVQSVEKADIEGMQPSMAGFSISDGGTENINFGVVNGVLAISGINY